ncbi:hypothetical protein QJS10_CPB12g01137 [Acorus calamus]|uniref:Uncharacterized protein n=1 Tax=Acorus calamus TaxID=4465 RepID=A0AAV9DP73_ACOCL|nr:hypothetical protein QJS10_CPB12g01137 [Acorus calamus]
MDLPSLEPSRRTIGWRRSPLVKARKGLESEVCLEISEEVLKGLLEMVTTPMERMERSGGRWRGGSGGSHGSPSNGPGGGFGDGFGWVVFFFFFSFIADDVEEGAARDLGRGGEDGWKIGDVGGGKKQI